MGGLTSPAASAFEKFSAFEFGGGAEDAASGDACPAGERVSAGPGEPLAVVASHGVVHALGQDDVGSAGRVGQLGPKPRMDDGAEHSKPRFVPCRADGDRGDLVFGMIDCDETFGHPWHRFEDFCEDCYEDCCEGFAELGSEKYRAFPTPLSIRRIPDVGSGSKFLPPIDRLAGNVFSGDGNLTTIY